MCLAQWSDAAKVACLGVHLCAFMCVYACVCVCVYACLCAFLRVFMCVFMCVNVRVYVCVFMCVPSCTCLAQWSGAGQIGPIDRSKTPRALATDTNNTHKPTFVTRKHVYPDTHRTHT